MVIPGPDGIDLDVWNDGIFRHKPLRYDDGVILKMYVARLSYEELRKLIKKSLMASRMFGMYYRLPQCDLDYGLIKVENDTDLIHMYDLSKLHGGIEMYIDHCDIDLSNYLAQPDPSTLSDGTSAKRPTPRKRYCNEFTQEEKINWDELEAEAENDKDKGKGKEKLAVDYLSPGEVHSDDSSESDGILSSDSDDSEYSNKSFDYLSPGEEELIQLRRRKANRTKERSIPIPDMTANPSRTRPNLENKSEVLVEHDEFLSELLRKLKGDDSGENLQDPFVGVESNQDKYPTHDQTTHWKLKEPKLKEKYESAAQLKECITYYALANGYSIWYERTSKDAIIAVCGQRKPKVKDPDLGKQRKQFRYPSVYSEDTPKCSYRLYARWMLDEQTFQIISLKPQHTCVRNFEFGSLVDYKWIAKHFGDKIRKNPEIKLKDIADLVKKKYNCTITPNQCRAAKTKALTEYEKTLDEHYALIRSYGKELLDSNPGSTVKLGVTNSDDKTFFDRFYACLGGLKEGFKNGCRRVIALDGCFLKKPNHGEILTAIGRDGNNHIYPVAWAVVSVENKENWCWFLELLGDDLDMPTGQGLTLMSDQHKGLIQAIKQVMPDAEHRQCARHIYENFKKQFSGLEFRNLFWAASKASYPQQFNKIMETIKSANPSAHQFLMDKNPETWSMAFFQFDRGCEAVENGFSECFNAVLVSVRDKPLLTMLEAMRVIVLERMNIMRKISAKWTDDICPSIKKRLDLLKNHMRYWHVIPTGGNAFEVRSGSQAFKVNISERTCNCRIWQLSGLPCVHATCAIFKVNMLPEEFVPNWFRKEMYYAAYHNYLSPVAGIEFWPDQSQYSTVLPPKPQKMPGRPRKKIIRSKGEGGSGTRMSKVGINMTCQNCYQVGHNKKGCMNPSVAKPLKQKRRVGRPSKGDSDPPSGNSATGLGGTGVGGSGSGLRGSANAMGGFASGEFGSASGEVGSGPLKGHHIPGLSFSPPNKRSFNRYGGVKFATSPSTVRRVNQKVQRGWHTWFGDDANYGSQSNANEAVAASQRELHMPSQDEIPSQATNDHVQISQEVQPRNVQPTKLQPKRRLPSQRILQQKLSKTVHGEGSSQNTAVNLD